MSAILQSSAMVADEPESELKQLRWIVAQEGSRENYGVPVAFHRLGRLRMLYADIWCRVGKRALRLGPEGARALATRFHREIPGHLVVSFSPAAIMEKSRQHLRRTPLDRTQHSEEYCRFGRWYAQNIRRHLESVETNPDRDCFFGFNTNCLELMDLLKERHIFTVVDQVDPGRVEEEMVLEERDLWPGWTDNMAPMSEEYWRRIEAEWHEADCVLVNSEWSRQALTRQGVPPEKLIVVPLALDLNHKVAPQPLKATGTLRVLWLGSVNLRKGIQYLVDAARLLEGHDIEFLVAGPLEITSQAVEAFPRNMKVLGRVTRDRVNKIYKRAHVFVLPTLSDGFAITQLEAMSHGLPVIATPHCGQVVTDGEDGLIVPARDSQALADAIARLETNRPLIRGMSCAALRTVKNYDLLSNARLINQLARSQRAGWKKRR